MKHFTDKGTGGLFAEYEEMFSYLKDEKITYLEIGVLEGGSIEWANEFFKKGKIIGADRELLPETKDLKGTLLEIDQADIKGMDKLGKDFGEFDIVVDDASHRRELTANTFNALWKYVKPGGWYIIEDWDAGYTKDPNIYQGLVELVTEILINKPKYGIDNVKIIKKKKSFAAFQKNNI